jgi:hypothetical protein
MTPALRHISREEGGQLLVHCFSRCSRRITLLGAVEDRKNGNAWKRYLAMINKKNGTEGRQLKPSTIKFEHVSVISTTGNLRGHDNQWKVSYIDHKWRVE